VLGLTCPDLMNSVTRGKCIGNRESEQERMLERAQSIGCTSRGDGCVSCLLTGVLLHDLTVTLVHELQELVEAASNVSSVAIQHLKGKRGRTDEHIHRVSTERVPG
jgi:hypothetical protein